MVYNTGKNRYNLDAPENNNADPMNTLGKSGGALAEAVRKEEERFDDWVDSQRGRNPETLVIGKQMRTRTEKLLTNKEASRMSLDAYTEAYRELVEECGKSPLDIKVVRRFLSGHLADASNTELGKRYPSEIEGEPCLVVLAPLPPGDSGEKKMRWEALVMPASEEVASQLNEEGRSRGSMLAGRLPAEFMNTETGLAMKVPPFNYDSVDPFNEASSKAFAQHQIDLLQAAVERMKRAKRMLEPDADLEEFEKKLDDYLEKTTRLLLHIDEETPVPTSHVSGVRLAAAEKKEGVA